jgi:hypothetical protein
MTIKYTPGPVVKKSGPKSAYSAHLGDSSPKFGEGKVFVGGVPIGTVTDFSMDTNAPLSDEMKEFLSPASTGQVTVHKKDVLIKENHTKFPSAPVAKSELCTVTVGGSQTVNLGNYESAKISVSATIPCTQESMDDAYEFASAWVSAKIEDAIKGAKKGTG